MALILALLLSIQQPVMASQISDCEDTLKSCSTLVDEQKKQLDLFSYRLDIAQQQQDLLKKQLEEVTPSWYEKPSVILPLGIVLGILLGNLTHQH